MSDLNRTATDFLTRKRIAVVGVSHTKQDAANLIYRKLRDQGYQVFAVNPNAESVEGDPCYADLTSIDGGVDGAVIVTRPEATERVVRDCQAAGVHKVWMHRSLMGDSVSDEAVHFCRDNGIEVIAGGCPMMFCAPDFGHRCMKWIMGLTGGLPK